MLTIDRKEFTKQTIDRSFLNSIFPIHDSRPTDSPPAKSQTAYSLTDSTLDKDSETATKLAAPNSTHPKSPTLQLPPQQHRQQILIDRLYICDRTQPRTNLAQLVSPIVAIID